MKSKSDSTSRFRSAGRDRRSFASIVDGTLQTVQRTELSGALLINISQLMPTLMASPPPPPPPRPAPLLQPDAATMSARGVQVPLGYAKGDIAQCPCDDRAINHKQTHQTLSLLSFLSFTLSLFHFTHSRRLSLSVSLSPTHTKHILKTKQHCLLGPSDTCACNLGVMKRRGREKEGRGRERKRGRERERESERESERGRERERTIN